MAALTLEEYAPAGTDVPRALALVIVHDLIEIDAGDTFAYDATAQDTKAERERAAAERIFGLLEPDQSAGFRALWEEFEAQETPSARFANALDRLQPLLLNMQAGGGSWKTQVFIPAEHRRRMRDWPSCADRTSRSSSALAVR